MLIPARRRGRPDETPRTPRAGDSDFIGTLSVSQSSRDVSAAACLERHGELCQCGGVGVGAADRSLGSSTTPRGRSRCSQGLAGIRSGSVRCSASPDEDFVQEFLELDEFRSCLALGLGRGGGSSISMRCSTASKSCSSATASCCAARSSGVAQAIESMIRQRTASLILWSSRRATRRLRAG